MKTTRITTFGYDYGDPPKTADQVFDVRDLPDFPFDPDHTLESRAKEIMDQIQPGDHVAIGCEYGHDRSPYVAREIAENFGDVVVEHRDYDHHMKGLEDRATHERQ